MKPMSYNRFERKMAKAMDSFPLFKSMAKLTYQRVSYIFFQNKRVQTELHPSAPIYNILKNEACGKKQEAFFGYYDKCPWSFDGRYYLTHILTSRKELNIAIYDTVRDNLNILGETSAYNLQQGAMLAWLTYNSDLCAFNVVEKRCLVAKIVSTLTGQTVQRLTMPIQTINPTGTEALTLNYRRLYRIRPEYGYDVDVDNFSMEMDESKDGIWKIDLTGNQADLIVSLKEMRYNNSLPTMHAAHHKINHILYSPSGDRFAFMHRWIGSNGKFSRLYTANSNDGTELYCLADERMVSHYAWLDDKHLIAWAREKSWGDKYYLFHDQSDQFTIIGDHILDPFGDGHPSFSPDKRWLLTDTYPDKARMRHLLLFNIENNKIVTVGRFFSPLKYDGSDRCDLHPRWNHDGTQISIDSVHEGFRNSYIIDVSKLVKNA